MVYSLTNASTLGLDLARTPGGVEAAGVLLRGLLAPPVGPGTPAPPPGPADLTAARVRALALVGPSAPVVVDVTDAATADPAAGSAGGSDGGDADPLAATLRRLLRRLGTVSFGTAADLMVLALDLPRTDGATTPVDAAGPPTGLRVVDAVVAEHGQALADAVLAALVRARPDPAGPVLARALSRRLDPPHDPAASTAAAPRAGALPPAPAPGRALPPGPTADLLARLAAVTDPAVLQPAHGPAPHVWAQHMHEAAWAVETTGRTRTAAVAQLDLPRCLAAADVPTAAYLSGVWNTCSAAVQAHVVADVLDADSWTVLTADLLDALPDALPSSG